MNKLVSKHEKHCTSRRHFGRLIGSLLVYIFLDPGLGPLWAHGPQAPPGSQAPKMAKEVDQGAQHGPRDAQERSKLAQEETKMAQEEPKRLQDLPKVAPRAAQDKDV